MHLYARCCGCGRYGIDQRILVLGDGDFSFSRGLLSHLGGDGSNVTCTSYDSATEVVSKYPGAKDILRAVAKTGARVRHGVDARKLESHFGFEDVFDRIVFNFPHSGQQRVHINRALLRDFFASAKEQLAPGGHIHVTLKTSKLRSCIAVLCLCFIASVWCCSLSRRAALQQLERGIAGSRERLRQDRHSRL